MSSSKLNKEVQKKDVDVNKLNTGKDKDETKSSKSSFNHDELTIHLKRKCKQRASETLQTSNEPSSRKRHEEHSDEPSTECNPPARKRERMSSAEKSKIAPFLPEQQLWHWSGKSIKRTGNKGSRTRKVYYREIERGREHIRVDDCAVFLSTGILLVVIIVCFYYY